MQRKPVVRNLAITAAWLSLLACGTENADLFSGVITASVEPPAPNDPASGPPVAEAPPVMSEPLPSFGESMTGGVVLSPPVMPEKPSVTPPPEPPASPRVLAISPENGARGVSNDVSIVLTFDVPMSQEQTQAAYQSEGIPSGDVTFSWNDEGTQLTITPNEPLAYPTGGDPDAVESEPISFFISTSAADLDGQRLAAPVEFSFALLRQINVTLPAQQNRDLTGSWRSNDTYGQGDCARNQDTICVGDTGNSGDQYKGFISFDVSELPGSVTRLADARLSFQITQRPGNPFNGLGPLFLDHAAFEAIGPGAFQADPLAALGEIATSGAAGTVLQVDVTEALAQDLGARNLSQFRLQFEQTTDDDGNADTLISAWDTQRIDVSYLIP